VIFFVQKLGEPSAGMGETMRRVVLFWKTTITFGYLHRNNNSYTGTSPGLVSYRASNWL